MRGWKVRCERRYCLLQLQHRHILGRRGRVVLNLRLIVRCVFLSGHCLHGDDKPRLQFLPEWRVKWRPIKVQVPCWYVVCIWILRQWRIWRLPVVQRWHVLGCWRAIVPVVYRQQVLFGQRELQPVCRRLQKHWRRHPNVHTVCPGHLCELRSYQRSLCWHMQHWHYDCCNRHLHLAVRLLSVRRRLRWKLVRAVQRRHLCRRRKQR